MCGKATGEQVFYYVRFSYKSVRYCSEDEVETFGKKIMRSPILFSFLFCFAVEIFSLPKMTKCKYKGTLCPLS